MIKYAESATQLTGLQDTNKNFWSKNGINHKPAPGFMSLVRKCIHFQTKQKYHVT